MKTVQEVLEAFETAALKAGLARNTRKTYAPVIAEFVTMLKAGKIAGVQGYLDHLSTVKKLSSNSVWHALNPLKFLYEKVLGKEFGQFDLPIRNRIAAREGRPESRDGRNSGQRGPQAKARRQSDQDPGELAPRSPDPDGFPSL